MYAVLQQQAYAATGTQVAVKVRHPGVVRSIQRDFALMLQAAKLATVIPAIRKLRPQETLAQFAAPLQEQVISLTHCFAVACKAAFE